jgi:hypothetical protein
MLGNQAEFTDSDALKHAAASWNISMGAIIFIMGWCLDLHAESRRLIRYRICFENEKLAKQALRGAGVSQAIQ